MDTLESLFPFTKTIRFVKVIGASGKICHSISVAYITYCIGGRGAVWVGFIRVKFLSQNVLPVRPKSRDNTLDSPFYQVMLIARMSLICSRFLKKWLRFYATAHRFLPLTFIDVQGIQILANGTHRRFKCFSRNIFLDRQANNMLHSSQTLTKLSQENIRLRLGIGYLRALEIWREYWEGDFSRLIMTLH